MNWVLTWLWSVWRMIFSLNCNTIRYGLQSSIAYILILYELCPRINAGKIVWVLHPECRTLKMYELCLTDDKTFCMNCEGWWRVYELWLLSVWILHCMNCDAPPNETVLNPNEFGLFGRIWDCFWDLFWTHLDCFWTNLF